MPRHIDENDKNIKFMANILSSRRGKDKILDEYHVVRTMNKKEKPVVSCFIPAEAGAFFKCRDGEAIAHTAVLDPADMAAEIRGWEDDKGKTWYMQFRSFAAVDDGTNINWIRTTDLNKRPLLCKSTHRSLSTPSNPAIMLAHTFKAGLSLRTTSLSVRQRPFSSASSLANPLLSAKPNPVSRLSPLRAQLLFRGAASQVSGRPGSQSFDHAATNIKEEVGNSTADFAKSIAGGNVYDDAVTPTTKDTFLGITNAVAHSVPTPYIVFGLAGGLPYLGATATTIYLARQAGMAATGVISTIDPGVAITVLDQALSLQMTYGAVMLSFLGALHWGFEFSGFGGHQGYSRLALGAAPVIWGWSTLAFMPMEALMAQWVGFTALWYADLQATNAGWAPRWYSQYRFYLSILVGTCIIGSLAATSYWGPVGGHGLVSHDLDMIRAERREHHPDREGLVKGDIEAVPAGEQADSYVVIRKKQQKKEGGEGQ
ncbi:hypothetical protein EUX98_g5795 [Antrodiella citrinella]|uniref:Uncharacterized protein n=1 Tax=Antrodiella citrinella TaxID=2447956 RepID=A0A4S4MSG3_9APHY|nr:hypothetical protein EUX98_g5795 [Antrodiella citrinella]